MVLRLGHDRAHADHDGGETAPGGLGPDTGDELLMSPQTDTLVGLQPGPGDDGEAGRLQALLDGGDVAGVDVSAAGSALDGVPRTGAEQAISPGSARGKRRWSAAAPCTRGRERGRRPGGRSRRLPYRNLLLSCRRQRHVPASALSERAGFTPSSRRSDAYDNGADTGSGDVVGERSGPCGVEES